ncbi:hypothetical protein [Alkalicoccus luteus]|uniref:Uncharacterized protein n=1 Tax=Alkalicoccus luteus TaxID=1237094 RepID=A0A969PP28_9BACI|nr:hypothetical protein [Alkalicoccus luteus]NJP37767.1 hypothetical protein [Alkalicoccus luteus]
MKYLLMAALIVTFAGGAVSGSLTAAEDTADLPYEDSVEPMDLPYED